MTFRDDREALRQKTESLESELASAKRELAEKAEQDDRIRDLEKQLAKARERLERVDPAMQGQGRPGPARIGVLVACIFLFVTMCGGAAAMFLLRSAPRPPPPEPAVQSPPMVPPSPEPAPPEAVREVKVAWGGTVRAAQGLPLAPGSKCALAATLRSGKGQYDTELSCGQHVLYRSSDPLNGMSTYSSSHFEMPGPEPGARRYWLKLEDQGTRTGQRAQVSIDTAAGTAVAWREGATAYRVEVAVDEAGAPIEPGTPPLDPARTWDKLRLDRPMYKQGIVTASTGPAPVKAGVKCSALLVPQWEQGVDCRLTVTCGTVAVYGDKNFGFGHCTVDGVRRTPEGFHDATILGDPAVELDLKTGRMKIDGKAADGRDWSVTIGL